MFVHNPDPYSLPCYRIGPFQTKDLSLNNSLPESNQIKHYFADRFQNRDFSYTENGRKAINLALDFYNLKKEDVVTILTTSENFYISSCVTKEIEKFCSWSRKLESRTRVLFVNHEFGYPYQEMDYLSSLGIPIIEDCCTTFFSQDINNKVGNYGDFAVYSFPKFFPIQIGGLLVNNNNNKLKKNYSIDKEKEFYIRNVLSYYISSLDDLLAKRRGIFNYGSKKLLELGFTERFERDESIIPSAMLLKNNSIIEDLPSLKKSLWEHGIHSSIFYGEDAFFIPSHQNLTELDVDYFHAVLNSVIIRKS